MCFIAEWMECTWTRLHNTWLNQPTLQRCWDFRRTGLATNTSNTCKANTPGLAGEDSQSPNRTPDPRRRERRCFLSLRCTWSMEKTTAVILWHMKWHLRASILLHCANSSKGQIPVLNNLSSRQGKLCSEEADFVRFSHCHVCLPPTCLYVFKSYDQLFSSFLVFFLFPPEVLAGFCLHCVSFNVSNLMY